ncbi:MAG: hypothetical protein C0501_15465 [Isosphaera sp.]|nr:hypothetical protein [Isosphaera sp.]
MSLRILPLALVLGLAGSLPAQEKKEDKKADPAAGPLEVTATGKATKYELDPAKAGAEFKKSLEDMAKKKGLVGGRPPAPPAVDLAVSIKNTSDKPVRVWVKGDPVVLTLELKGKGAVNVDSFGPMTLEFRLPEAVEIGPGKTYEMPLKALQSGMRGQTRFSYWTEPGEYELVAALRTGVSPAPKGSKEGMDGFGMVTATGPGLKLTVEAKK